MADLSAFLPWSFNELAVQLASGGPRFRRLEGTVLFTDVAGFTPLTEALAAMGREGAEELTRILNAYFTRMIAISDEEGGDVLRFGGDSLTILFPGARSSAGALRCASRMMEAMGSFAEVRTGAGTFSLSMKIGAARGPVLLGMVGDGERGFDFYAVGPPLDRAAQAEHQAGPGMTVLDPSLTGPLPEGLELRLEGGRRLLTGLPASPPGPAAHPPPPPPSVLRQIVPEVLHGFANPEVLGEHRGTSVLFVAIDGLPLEAVDRGEQGLLAALHEDLDLLHRSFCEAARRHGGYLNKIDMGDKGAKALLLFGSPRALENREEMAARAALHLLQNAPLPRGVTLRMGLTSAPLFVGPLGALHCREYTAMGNGINLAARLMQAAPAGGIRCDGATVRAVPSLEFREFPPLRLKGLKDPVVCYEPLGDREEGTSEKGRLIERGEIQRRLLRLLLRREGPPLLLRGAAGLGKTVLLEWSLGALREKGVPCVRVPLGPHSREKAYGAWRGPLRALLGLRRHDPPEKALALLRARLRGPLASHAPLLAPLLDLPAEEEPGARALGPSERKELTFALLKGLFEAGGRWALLFDNLHFADALSLEFLALLCQPGEEGPVRWAATLRPGFPDLEGAFPGAEVVDLLPLSERGISRLLVETFGLEEPETEVRRWFSQRSAGNPAVVSALLSALEAEGLVLRGPWGARIDGDRLFKTSFPETLEGLYLAPVDRLPAERKILLQQASVLGVSVSVNLLAVAAGHPLGEIEQSLRALEEARLLLPDTWGTRPYVRFPDTLLRDAVYSSAPFALRRACHARLAAFLEREEGENPKIWARLARHFASAGETLQARRYARLAGREAYERGDAVSAYAHFQLFAEGFSGEEEEWEDAFSALDTFKNLGKWEDYGRFLDRISDLSPRLPPLQKARLLNHEAHRAARRSDLEKAEALLRQSVRLGKVHRDAAAQAKGMLNLVGLLYGPRGEFSRAERLLKGVLALRLPGADRPLQAVAWMNLAMVYKHTGFFEKALKALEKGFRCLPEGRAAHTRAMAALNLCPLYQEMGRFAEGVRWGRKGLAIAERFALRPLLARGHSNLGLCLAAQGRSGAASGHLTRGLAIHRFLGDLVGEGESLQGLCRCSLELGRLAEGLEEARRALGCFREAGDMEKTAFALVDLALLFESLGDTEGLRGTLEEALPDGFRPLLEGSAAGGGALTVADAWARGEPPEALLRRAEALDRAWRVERLEGFLLAGESAELRGEGAAGRRALRLAARALQDYPDWLCRTRLALLAWNLEGRAPAAEELLPLLRRRPGGPWGLRLLCKAALSHPRREVRKEHLPLALRRLRTFRKHALEEQWARLLDFREVRDLLASLPEETAGPLRAANRRPKG